MLPGGRFLIQVLLDGPMRLTVEGVEQVANQVLIHSSDFA
jgi:hypothetical protein